MPAALLSLLLFAATVDPRLAGALRLLAEVGARDAIDELPGQFYADLPESLGLTLAVGELPNGAGGRYDPNTRTVTVTEAVLGEDPRAVAVILAHELQHAVEQQRVALDLLDADCLTLEVRGFQAQPRASPTPVFRSQEANQPLARCTRADFRRIADASALSTLHLELSSHSQEPPPRNQLSSP